MMAKGYKPDGSLIKNYSLAHFGAKKKRPEGKCADNTPLQGRYRIKNNPKFRPGGCYKPRAESFDPSGI
jgi:hypothetical protein